MKKILIVDDSDTLRDSIRSFLIENGLDVLEASNGKSGLEIIKNTPDLDLIIADVNMPEMNGIEMCKRISCDQNIKKIPIFMLTTETSPELKRQGKEYGVMAWIAKPFTMEKVFLAIKKVLDM
ncbi:MAG: response regulator [Oligoflexia bacterium]|nr:response regulator [Oligoflexia bacterium]